MAESAEERLNKSRERYKRLSDSLPITPDQDGNGFSTFLHGFRYGDVNRAGRISFSKLCKYFEAGRTNVWTLVGCENDPFQLAFIVGIHIEISADFYQTMSMATKMRMVTKLSSVGNSSFSFHTSMIDESSGQVMASMLRELVHINAQSRKPEPLTPTFRQKAKSVLEVFQLQAPPRLSLPSANRQNSFHCKITVLNIDMDIYYHTTQLKYVDYALECAAQATESGYYKRLKRDIHEYCVKKSSFAHIGESRAGDELLVLTWEDQLNPLLLYFAVTKEGKDICQAMMEFYDPYVYSNL